MKFESMKGKYRKDLNNAKKLYDDENRCWSLKPGEFCWWQGLENGAFAPRDADHPLLWYCPPGEPRAPMSATCTVYKNEQNRVGMKGTYWWWNGDEEKPTLEPSIGVYNSQVDEYDWHGFLTEGEWNACE